MEPAVIERCYDSELLGAENAGILNTVTYLVGLSGSTWAIGGWLLSGNLFVTYHDWLVNNVNYGLKKSEHR